MITNCVTIYISVCFMCISCLSATAQTTSMAKDLQSMLVKWKQNNNVTFINAKNYSCETRAKASSKNLYLEIDELKNNFYYNYKEAKKNALNKKVEPESPSDNSWKIDIFNQPTDPVSVANQMFTQGNDRIADGMKQLFGTITQVGPEYEKNLKINVAFGGSYDNDRYLITFFPTKGTTVPKVDIKYTVSDDSRDKRTISLSACEITGSGFTIPVISTPEILRPGYTVYIYRQLDGELLFKGKIPDSETPEYALFQAEFEKNKRIKQNLQNFPDLFTFPNSQNSFSNPSNNSTPSKGQSACSMCGGTGEVATSTASYVGGTKWCNKCNKDVPEGHYHNTCPSCGGKGSR